MQISHTDNRNRIYNDTQPTFSELSGNNIESLIRAGAILDFSASAQKSLNLKGKSLKRCKFKVKEISLRKDSVPVQSFKDLINGIQFLSIYQDFDFFEFSQIGENKVKNKHKYSYPKTNIETHKCDILRLFDTLANNINRLKLASTNFLDSKGLNIPCFNEIYSVPGNDINNIDRYIINDINNFFGLKKQTQFFLNKSYKYFKFPLRLLNTYYGVCTKLCVELIVQIVRIINIIILTNKDLLFNICPYEFVIVVLTLITVCFDIIFYFFNWNTTSKIGMVIEIIHLIFISLCFYDHSYINMDIFNICGCLLYYSYIYRIVFILQCKYINIYNKFQVMEIIRTQLKHLFFSFDSEMSLMISSSEFEDICIKLGIDKFYKSKFVKRSLNMYLFQNPYWTLNKLFDLNYNVSFFCIKELKFTADTNYHQWLLIINKVYCSYCNPIYIKLSCLFYKSGAMNILGYYFVAMKFIFCNLIKNIKRKLSYVFKCTEKTNFIAYQDFISTRKKITYEEFEMLLISLDSERRLLNKIESNTGLFDIINGSCLLLQRKVIFEQFFYDITLFICLSISTISIIEMIFNYFSDRLFRMNNIFSNYQSYFYLFIIIISSLFHYKMDKIYYNSSLKSYNRIKCKYNSIYGHLQFIEDDTSSKNDIGNSTYGNDYLSEFISYRNAELLQNYANSLSKYLPQGIAMSLLKKYDFASLNPQYKEITILFSDIVGFTNIAEKINPFLLFKLLTNYFDEMIKIIEEFNGNLLEIVGDAILVIWNSPTALENHSVAAIAASLKMKKHLQLKSRSFQNNSLPKINIKCGIHTDHVLVGNIGCNKRIKYGIMGDGVNLASRIESLTKRYYADIIISNNVFINKNVRRKFIICPLDIVIVQGKSNPTVIYHVLSTVQDSDLISVLKSKFHTKALIFFINRDFKKSLRYIEKINKLGPFKNDPTTMNLLNKCKKLQDKKLDVNWSCAEVLDDKYFNE